MKTKLMTLSLFIFGSNLSYAGEMFHYSYESKILNRTSTYNIYLPDGWSDNDNVKYPIIYALHGSGGDEYNWNRKARAFDSSNNIEVALDRLIDEKKLQKTIVVFPGAYQSWWVDGKKEKVMESLVSEFIPYIEKKWHGIPNREGRGLIGLSMGAYGALNLSVRYPELFSTAGILSPSSFGKYENIPKNSVVLKHDAFVDSNGFDKKLYEMNDYSNFLESYKEKKKVVSMYISSGDRDKYGIEKIAFDIYSTFYSIQPDSVVLNIIPNTNHEWKAWNSVVEETLLYMSYYLAYPGDASQRGIVEYNLKNKR